MKEIAIDPDKLRSAAEARRDERRPGALPNGIMRTGLTKIVRDHFDVLSQLRAQGVSWKDIAHSLAEQGAAQSDERPFSNKRLAAIFAAAAKQRMRSGSVSTDTRQRRKGVSDHTATTSSQISQSGGKDASTHSKDRLSGEAGFAADTRHENTLPLSESEIRKNDFDSLNDLFKEP